MIKATDIPQTFDSKLERDFWFWLAAEREAGRIKAFWYQSQRLRIGGRVGDKGSQTSWYTPDFQAQTKDDEIIQYETKGHMREAALVRIRAAASLYPYRFILVRKADRQWSFVEVAP